MIVNEKIKIVDKKAIEIALKKFLPNAKETTANITQGKPIFGFTKTWEPHWLWYPEVNKLLIELAKGIEGKAYFFDENHYFFFDFSKGEINAYYTDNFKKIGFKELKKRAGIK
jgi:hypothetical protein